MHAGRASRQQRAVAAKPPSARDPHVAGTIGWLAWGLWMASVVLSALGIVFLVLSASTPIPPGFGFRGAVIIFALTFSTVGAVVAARRPQNPVGWVFCAGGLVAAIVGFAAQYSVYAVLTRPGSLPLGAEVAWVAEWMWWLLLGAVAYVFLLFPDGRLLSRRWRPLAWLAGIGPATIAIGTALTPGPLQEFVVVRNPFGLEGLEHGGLVGDLVNVLGWLGVLGLVLALVGAAASLVVRFRRARGEQRLQLKWIAYAAALAASAQATTFAVYLLVRQAPMAIAVLVICAVAAIPIAAGIAILKYRLYDIDRIIHRTLVYGLLTALLGVTYAGVVLVLGQLFGDIGGEPPSWAVAGATLAAAALFRPARRRIQQAVDRRFNRRRYDAAQTIETFSVRLREQVDLDTISAELLAVVDQTMQSTTASLWLRPPASTSQDHGDAVAHRPAARPIEPSRSGRRGL
jgi:hypothetical protein